MLAILSQMFSSRRPTRVFGILFISIICLFLFNNHSSHAQQNGIQVGQTVEVNTSGQNLNLRSNPGLNQSIVAKLPDGTRMLVTGGPETADGYTWWKLEGAPGTGWAAQNYLIPVDANNAPASQPGTSGCENQVYAGVQYCERDNGVTHVVVIDLADPHLRFETVMAKDTKSVNTGNREFVRDMADRHKAEGVVLAINADYFGDGSNPHGPEGLTIVEGKRLDGDDNGDDDDNSVNRSSFLLSRPLIDGGSSPTTVQITRFPSDKIDVDIQNMYNAIGGGPQVVFDGTWDWTRGRNHSRYKYCPPQVQPNDVINGECFGGTSGWDEPTKVWSAVGVTDDNRLVFVVTPFSNVQTVFAEWGVQGGFKLDGGGSAQIWYNNRSLSGGGRPVANGLLVFYKYAYQVKEQSRWPVVLVGESAKLRFVLHNTGADTWNPGSYKITSEKNGWNQSRQFDLPNAVDPGGDLTFEVQTQPTDKWGIENYEFKLVDKDIPFPSDPISIKVIILPQELAKKKAELERKIQEWIADGKENLDQAILDWIGHQLNSWLQKLLDIICPNAAAFAPIGFFLVYGKIYQKRRRGIMKDFN